MSKQERNNADAALRQIGKKDTGVMTDRFKHFMETPLGGYVAGLGKSDKKPISDWSDIADSFARSIEPT